MKEDLERIDVLVAFVYALSTEMAKHNRKTSTVMIRQLSNGYFRNESEQFIDTANKVKNQAWDDIAGRYKEEVEANLHEMIEAVYFQLKDEFDLALGPTFERWINSMSMKNYSAERHIISNSREVAKLYIEQVNKILYDIKKEKHENSYQGVNNCSV